jgi:hypothetical protein
MFPTSVLYRQNVEHMLFLLNVWICTLLDCRAARRPTEPTDCLNSLWHIHNSAVNANSQLNRLVDNPYRLPNQRETAMGRKALCRHRYIRCILQNTSCAPRHPQSANRSYFYVIFCCALAQAALARILTIGSSTCRSSSNAIPKFLALAEAAEAILAS